ncbi:uncharacterized protein LOC117224571 isoform X2 [Megalopta genalis]|uniref:uncharacterized protein LOC117224571 isoform X2 n=1 Tax=Megalopta genalis TaxID=115081 RepID=UPI003FD30D41
MYGGKRREGKGTSRGRRRKRRRRRRRKEEEGNEEEKEKGLPSEDHASAQSPVCSLTTRNSAALRDAYIPHRDLAYYLPPWPTQPNYADPPGEILVSRVHRSVLRITWRARKKHVKGSSLARARMRSEILEVWENVRRGNELSSHGTACSKRGRRWYAIDGLTRGGVISLHRPRQCSRRISVTNIVRSIRAGSRAWGRDTVESI